MKKIIKIIKREFLTKIMSKGFIIGTLLGPIFIIGLTLGPAYFMSLTTEEPITLDVVDYSGLISPKLSSVFTDTLKNGQPRFVFSPIDPSVYQQKKETIRHDVEKGLVTGVLIIPQDILAGGKVRYISKSISDIELMQRIRGGISEIVNDIRLNQAGLDPALVKKLVKKVELQTIKLVKGQEEKRGFDQEYISAMMFLIILYMTIIVYGSAIMRSVIEEKTSRIIEVLLSSANSFQLMFGKLFGVGSVGLVQYIVWAFLGTGAFYFATASMPGLAGYINISPVILIYFILFFIIGFFTFSTLYAAVGAMCSDMQDAQSLSTPVTLLVILPFMISFMVIKDPSSQIAQILSYLPFFTPLIMFLRIVLVAPPFWEVLLSLAINIVTIVGIIWLSARIYRVGILMYGKRPTVPEIIRWIRYS